MKIDVQQPQSKVALISMPTLTANMPSFQLGLLKPTLEKHGIDIQTFSLYLYFGQHVGWRLNDALSNVRASMVGEWIWATAAFGHFAEDDDYLTHYEHDLNAICQQAGCRLDDLLLLKREGASNFIDFCMDSIDWSRFGLIGFSIVFQQMTASLALARRLKERYPCIPIILGGATFEDDIAEGVMEGAPWIDYIHCGDGDVSFPNFVKKLFNDEPIDDQVGILWRHDGEVRNNGRAPNLTNLDITPVPDFDEYFYARKASGYEDAVDAKEPMLPIETARGCWWGEKSHCTFCGLNRAGMAFRAKSVNNVIEMIDALTQKYQRRHFDAIDNIMSTEYVDNLFSKLAELNSDVQFHYEVRPYLSQKRLALMHKGGLFSVQPGIESLSTHVLKLMKKNTTGIKNLEFIKWCTYYQINNLYNILYGFPGERLTDYEQQKQVMIKVPHFQPPWALAKARADRGSPMFTDPQAHAVTNVRPNYCYHFIFPGIQFDLEKVSYFFDHDVGNLLPLHEYASFKKIIENWQASWHSSDRAELKYYKLMRVIQIIDSRYGKAQEYVYDPLSSKLYEFCHNAKSLTAIYKNFSENNKWVQPALALFLERDHMIFLDGRYLSLALPANNYL